MSDHYRELRTVSDLLKQNRAKHGFMPPSAAAGAAPPGGMPMDPAMMGGAPPAGMPMDPAAMGGMPPGGMPMDPAMMGGAPPAGMPMDPAMMGGDPPEAGNSTGITKEDLRQVLQEVMQGVNGGGAGGDGKPRKQKAQLEEMVVNLNGQVQKLTKVLLHAFDEMGFKMPPSMFFDGVQPSEEQAPGMPEAQAAAQPESAPAPQTEPGVLKPIEGIQGMFSQQKTAEVSLGEGTHARGTGFEEAMSSLTTPLSKPTVTSTKAAAELRALLTAARSSGR